MNKTDFISSVAAKSGLTKVDSKKAYEAFVETVKEQLKKGNKVVLLGFGTFSVIKKAKHAGINPRTKAPITIPARKSAKFKAGADLAKAVK